MEPRLRYLNQNGMLTLQERHDDETWHNVPVVTDVEWINPDQDVCGVAHASRELKEDIICGRVS